jgi:hypothetical protein
MVSTPSSMSRSPSAILRTSCFSMLESSRQLDAQAIWVPNESSLNALPYGDKFFLALDPVATVSPRHIRGADGIPDVFGYLTQRLITERVAEVIVWMGTNHGTSGRL